MKRGNTYLVREVEAEHFGFGKIDSPTKTKCEQRNHKYLRQWPH